MEPGPPALGVHSLSHRTTREVPPKCLFMCLLKKFYYSSTNSNKGSRKIEYETYDLFGVCTAFLLDCFGFGGVE